MKVLTTALTALALMITLSLLGTDVAQAQGRGNGYTVRGFVDNDGDGFNDLAPDHDGDGIPNGQDPDYVRPQDGTGNKFGNAGNQDDDTFQNWYRKMCRLFGGDTDLTVSGFGPGDGTGNGGDGPQDGTGNGPGGDGDCDGGGPYGPGRP